MTGDDFTETVLVIFIALVAISVPALIATLIRKYFVKPDPNPSLIANTILPPIIYFIGFIAIWAICIYQKWDGSKSLAHLIIAPVHFPLWSTTYAALVGAATALFSIPLSRSVKCAEHHANIFIFTQFFLYCIYIILLLTQSEARHFFF